MMVVVSMSPSFDIYLVSRADLCYFSPTPLLLDYYYEGLEADEFEEKGKPVFDLDLGSQSDSQDSSDDEDDDEDVIANLSDHLPHSVRGEPEVGMSIILHI